MAWAHPAWTNCLREFSVLRVLSVRSPLLLAPVDRGALQGLISKWGACVPFLHRIYLMDAYDDTEAYSDLHIGCLYYSGRIEVFDRNMGSGTWTRSTKQVLGPQQSHINKTSEEDQDVLDSDDE